jgi:hypothetical protein
MPATSSAAVMSLNGAAEPAPGEGSGEGDGSAGGEISGEGPSGDAPPPHPAKARIHNAEKTAIMYFFKLLYSLQSAVRLTVSFTYVNPQLAPQPLYRVLPAPLAFKKRRHVLKEHPSGRTGLVHGKVINISDHIYICVYILPA